MLNSRVFMNINSQLLDKLKTIFFSLNIEIPEKLFVSCKLLDDYVMFHLDTLE